MIYLDNSATTRAFDSVASVVQEALTQNYFNASSPYKKALDTEKAIESAAKTVAGALNCRPEEQQLRMLFLWRLYRLNK